MLVAKRNMQNQLDSAEVCFSFLILSLFYKIFLSKFTFSLNSPYSDHPVFGRTNKVLGIYVSFGGLIRLLIPIAYILEGIYVGDNENFNPEAPHLFILAGQVLMEGITFSGNFSLPILVFVPVFYNSKRIFTIVDWLRFEFYERDLEYGGNWRRLYVGRGLVVANMVFWCFNLFGFLLPIFCLRPSRYIIQTIKAIQ